MKDQTLELTEEKDENTTIILHNLTKCKNKARDFFKKNHPTSVPR